MHKHITIAKHSPEQERMFFGISHDLGYDEEKVKDRAKKYFNVNCFNALKSMQLGELIDKLVEKQYGNVKK